MNKYSLFYEISQENQSEIYALTKSEKHTFKKGEVIMRFNDGKNNAGIVENGLAFLLSISDQGEKSILDYYEKGNVFGYQFSPNTPANLYYVAARKDCTVNIFQHKKLLLAVAENEQYNVLMNNLISGTIRKTQMHIDILSQKTIRKKLLTYIKYICSENSSNTVKLPLSLTDLADYISTDRSAMMRELKKMREQNIIFSDGQTVTLL